MADFDRIRRNVERMAGMNAPIEDIDGYLATEGLTPETFKAAMIEKPEPSMISKAGTYADNMVRQAANALTFNLADEAAAGANALIGRGDYESNLRSERARDKAFSEENTMSAIGAQIAGAALPLIATGGAAAPAVAPKLGAQVGKGILLGSGLGAGYGFGGGEGDFESRVVDAMEGAALGGALGGLAPVAVAGVGGAMKKGLQSALDRTGGASTAERKVASAIADTAGGDIKAGVANVRQALAGAGDDAVLADVTGIGGQKLARAAANVPGASAQKADDFVAARMAGRGGRMRAAADKSLAPTEAYYGTLDDLLAQRADDATPLYEKAFSGGSTAPLERQFEVAFADAAKAETAASANAAQARQMLAAAKAKMASLPSEFSHSDPRNPFFSAVKEAERAVAMSERELSAVQAGKEAIRNRLGMAQADRLGDVPGAVWSPRIQQFLDDPISRKGLSQGLEVQRLEALARGKRFDPTEFAVTGFDDAGEPVVSSVPNLRTLDAVKRGLDEMLEAYRDGTTGKLNLDQRGRAINEVRKSLVRELDDLTGGDAGAYAQARAAWAGPSAAKDALSMGRRFVNNDAEVTAKVLDKMSAGDKEMFRIGAARAVRDMINSDTQAAITKFADKKEGLWGKLRQIFPDEQSFNQFRADIQTELRKAQTERFMGPRAGSQTTPLREDIKGLSRIPAPILEAAQRAGRGEYMGAVGGLVRAPFERLAAPSQATANELADILLGMNPQAQQRVLSSIEGRTQAADLLPMLAPDARNALARILSGVAGVESGQMVTP